MPPPPPWCGASLKRAAATRCPAHRLARWRRALAQVIEHERELLGRPARIRPRDRHQQHPGARSCKATSRRLLEAPANQLTLVFQSFGFKYGLPLDADYVFDVRMLPNPFYDPSLRPLDRQRCPGASTFCASRPMCEPCKRTSRNLSATGCPPCRPTTAAMSTVAVGCTGGQHRSVFLTEQLAAHFRTQWNTLLRHREMDARVASKP